MFYATSRADLKLHIEAGHQARSRAFFDLMSWIGKAPVKLIKRATAKFAAKRDHTPSRAMHA